MVASFSAALTLAVLLQHPSTAHCFGNTILHRRKPPIQGNAPTSASISGVAHASLSPRIALLPRARWPLLSSPNDDADDAAPIGEEADADAVDVTVDPRLRRVSISRAMGIDWGTDLSFSFVYVRAVEPSGAAALSGEIEVGDQICEMTPRGGAEALPINLIGAPFDEVMGAFASLGNTVREVDLVLFRGTKDELKELCAGGSGSVEEDTITITVIQNKGAKDEAQLQIEAPAGCNLRQILTDHQINVYQSLTRWTNCKGKQLCGTCIVNVAAGEGSTNRKSLDEGSTLRENPDSYRLSCVTFAYGDVTVETFPPIEAAQWTR